MVLCGLAAGGAGELPCWPLRENASRDEKLVAGITTILGFDEAQYEQLQNEVWDLTFESVAFERAFIASETLLRRFGVIGKPGIAIVEWAAWSDDEADGTEATEREPGLCAA